MCSEGAHVLESIGLSDSGECYPSDNNKYELKYDDDNKNELYHSAISYYEQGLEAERYTGNRSTT